MHIPKDLVWETSFTVSLRSWVTRSTFPQIWLDLSNSTVPFQFFRMLTTPLEPAGEGRKLSSVSRLLSPTGVTWTQGTGSSQHWSGHSPARDRALKEVACLCPGSLSSHTRCLWGISHQPLPWWSNEGESPWTTDRMQGSGISHLKSSKHMNWYHLIDPSTSSCLHFQIFQFK